MNISATNEERRAFDAAHPNLHVRWAEPPQTTPYWSTPIAMTDPWNVASVLFQRWQAEDGVREPKLLDREVLDFAEVRLTKLRVRRLPPGSFPDVRCINLGEVDSTKIAIELIDQCPKLESLHALHVSFDANDIARLAEKILIEDLRLQQGRVSAEEFCQLRKLPKLRWLEIYGSTFTYDEASRIDKAIRNKSRDAYVDVIRDFDNESDDSILYEPFPE